MNVEKMQAMVKVLAASGKRDKPKRFVRLFQERFWPAVRSGDKRQTVRGWPKRVPSVGDILDARGWSGKPYRSAQISLVSREIKQVGVVLINPMERRLCYNLVWLAGDAADVFARDDGFKNAGELFEWFAVTYPKTKQFFGIVIKW